MDFRTLAYLHLDQAIDLEEEAYRLHEYDFADNDADYFRRSAEAFQAALTFERRWYEGKAPGP